MHSTYHAILTQLDNAGAPYRQFRHEPLISAWELDEALPFPLDNLLTIGASSQAELSDG